MDDRFYKFLGPIPLGSLLSGLAVDLLETQIQDVEISRASDLEHSTPDDITFISTKKSLPALDTAKATACFVTAGLAAQVAERDIIPLITQTPRAHFGRVVGRLYETRTIWDEDVSGHVARSARVHSTAVISGSAMIADNVDIGPYCVIGPGVVIGEGSKLHNHVSIECAVIGEGCTIKSGACIGSSGFGVDGDETGILDLPHIGTVQIGDGVSIGSQTTIDRGFLGDTIIGDHVKIDNHVQIAHNVKVGSGTMMAGHVGISGSCIIGKNTMFGGNVGLADHLEVGDNARLAARAGVMHDVPAGETWSGIPAMPIRDHMRLISATRKLIAKPKKGGS